MAASRDEIARVSGPDSMARPEQSSSTSQPPSSTQPTSSTQSESSTQPASSTQPTSNTQPAPSTQPTQDAPENPVPPKKKKHRAGRKRTKSKRQSFQGVSEAIDEDVEVEERPSLVDAPNRSAQSAPFYRLQGANRSNTSLESEALLDHREVTPLRNRRHSLRESGFTRPSLPFARHRGSVATGPNKSRLAQASGVAISEDEDEDNANDRTPLLSSSRNHSRPELARAGSGNRYGSSYRRRRSSTHSKASTRRGVEISSRSYPGADDEDYDVNNPPSVPNSPKIGSLDDPMLNDLANSHSDRGRETVIDIDAVDRRFSSPSPEALRRRATLADLAERDVCFPHDAALSETADGDRQSTVGSTRLEKRRTRARNWPEFEILEDWSREEKEERTHQEHVRAKKINEPVLVEGRLRPGKTVWHKEEEDKPFRFTYFNEVFDGTIHARTISDLLQEGTTFKDLFAPEPVELDESEDEDDENALERPAMHHQLSTVVSNGHSRILAGEQSRTASTVGDAGNHLRSPSPGKSTTGSNTPSGQDTRNATPRPYQKPRRYGPRPTFWLDVLQPTEMEMKVLSKAFGIHQLTTEDILMEEQREKVELFQSYYFVNYRSFEQDKDSDDYMEPVNFYIVVFRDGVITFHHSMTPHPANVRRRIRQLNDYMSPTADWISYAIIDDVTDYYQPRTEQLEKEVDEIDEEILYMHVTSADEATGRKQLVSQSSKKSSSDDGENNINEKVVESGGDMLRRVGESRKNVMSLFRLLGNKADVIKGFAKRCNEHWEVAPRSEIGLYLGDIQDHIITMTSNLSHYESLLSRAHSNYVAQINIRMNERAEMNADVLGKLTVLGTIVLPMNIITGMWGMNVYVPGQDVDDSLTWFWCITAGLVAFGVTCFFVAKKVYGIV